MSKAPVSLYHTDYVRLRSMMKDMRKTAGFSQAELGQKLELGQSYVSKVERGANFVDVLLFVRWCAICGQGAGTTLKTLFDEHHHESQSTATVNALN